MANQDLDKKKSAVRKLVDALRVMKSVCVTYSEMPEGCSQCPLSSNDGVDCMVKMSTPKDYDIVDLPVYKTLE